MGQISTGGLIFDWRRCCERPGFEKIKIAPKDTSRSFIREWLPGKQIEDYLGSATIESTKSDARTANG
jgi:arsenite methyltransferase